MVPRAIDAALGRDRLSIFGADYDTPDGTCLRDYVHVTDLAAAHMLALESLRTGGPSTSFNLGNGRPVSVREVIASVARVAGRTVPVTVAPRRAGDPAVLFASMGGRFSADIQRRMANQTALAVLVVLLVCAWARRLVETNQAANASPGGGLPAHRDLPLPDHRMIRRAQPTISHVGGLPVERKMRRPRLAAAVGDDHVVQDRVEPARIVRDRVADELAVVV